MSETKVKVRVNPDSKDAHVVLTLIQEDIITPIRLSREEADKARRWLLGLEGANHGGPANLETPQGNLHMEKATWAPMLVELNKWYHETVERGKK